MQDFMFEIPFRLPCLNDHIDHCKTHWSKGSKFKNEIDESIQWVLPKKIKIDCPVSIRFIWYEQIRNRAKDNVAFAKKYILDAMQKAKMLPNDNNRYIAGFSDRFVYGQGDKVRVIVTTEGEDDETI
jgi:Holliday junction resolvase RusA-like endonuclease